MMKHSTIFISLSVVAALGCSYWFFRNPQRVRETERARAIRSRAEREANPVLPPGVNATGDGLERVKRFSKVEFTTAPKRVASLVNEGGFQGAAFSPDSKLLAIGSYAIQVHETQNWKLARTIQGDGASAFSPDSKLLAAQEQGSKTNSGVGIWRLSDGKQLRVLNDKSGLLSATGVWGPLAFSPDGKRLLTLGEDPNTKWRPATGSAEDNNTEASTIRDIALKVWDVSSGQRMEVLPGPSWGAYMEVSVAWIRNSSGVFEPRSFSKNSGFCLVDGHTLTVQNVGPYLSVEDLTDQQLVRNLPCGNQISAVALSPEATIVVGGIIENYGGNTIKIWRTFDGKLLSQFTGEGDQVQAITISPDGKMLAITSRSGGGGGSITAVYAL